MDNKKCGIVRDVLPLYIDGVVCSQTKEFLEAHLAECPECAAYAKELRATPVIPVNADAHSQIVVEIKSLKRMLKKKWFRNAVFSAICVLALVTAAFFWLILTVDEIEYDGSNIAIEESEDGTWLMLRYYGRGDVLWGLSIVPETGEGSMVVTQTVWDRYIDPIYDGASGRYYLMDSDQALIIRDQETGEVLWEADEDQARRFHERQAAEAAQETDGKLLAPGEPDR